MKYIVSIFLFCLLSSCSKPGSQSDEFINWSTYLGDHASSQYSPLDQINRDNVSALQVAWQYDGGEAHPDHRSQIQCNPLVINGVLYGTTASLKVIALDAATGELLWSYNPYSDDFDNFGMGVNRGLMYHEGADHDILLYGAGQYVIALNPSDGSLRDEFGQDGYIDLQQGLGTNDSLLVLANTPGIIYQDLMIIGGRVSESTGAAPGHIRAFDVHTGEQKWIFHTIPKPGQAGYDSWPQDAYKRVGGANVWSGMALDIENDLVYCPTGSAAYDFYGGDRHGSNLYANSLLALRASTGEYVWHFQAVHHDIWDKDLPAPPNLFTMEKDGESILAIAQITKNGFVFIFNRLTGEALYPIVEQPVPSSELLGEQAWKTQPFPTTFPPFSRTELTAENLATRNPAARAYAEAIWENSNHTAGTYEPPSEKGTIIFPGFDGGGEWGGAAYDPEHGNLIINSNEVAWLNVMDKVKPASKGERTYQAHCQSCHGQTFESNQLYGNIPSLVNLKDRISIAEASQIIKHGKGIMPSFGYIDDESIEAVYHYINGEDDTEKALSSDWPYPYAMRGYKKLYAPDGYPMITPPWGQLTSINVESAKINWQIPLGEHAELTAVGMPITGTENYGGPIVTAGDLIFIGATMDNKIRAFDRSSGEELWAYTLPAAAYATPASYSINGKQYLVIACGGGKLGSDSGDHWLAFSL